MVTLNACSVTSDCELTTGVSNVQENTIHLYPNPNNGQFTVASSEDGVLEVIRMTGQLLLHQTISNGETSVSLSGVARGTYLVRITCGERVAHRRMRVWGFAFGGMEASEFAVSCVLAQFGKMIQLFNRTSHV